jgi:hypothetical protein
MRVIVTGPRTWTGNACYKPLFEVLSNLRDEYGVPVDETITIVEGEAKGFDRMCRTIGEALGYEIDPYPVETWYPGDVYNPEAGHERNQVMVDSGGDVAVAGIMPCVKKGCTVERPHDSHGTADCMERLEDAGIPIVKVYPEYDNE